MAHHAAQSDLRAKSCALSRLSVRALLPPSQRGILKTAHAEARGRGGGAAERLFKLQLPRQLQLLLLQQRARSRTDCVDTQSATWDDDFYKKSKLPRTTPIFACVATVSDSPASPRLRVSCLKNASAAADLRRTHHINTGARDAVYRWTPPCQARARDSAQRSECAA